MDGTGGAEAPRGPDQVFDLTVALDYGQFYISGEALAMQGAGWSGDLDAMREDAMREPDATAWPTDATAGS
jgi:hypothetical protein